MCSFPVLISASARNILESNCCCLWVSLQAFESLAILEGTSSMAQRALQNNTKLHSEDSRNLSTYFNKVRPN